MVRYFDSRKKETYNNLKPRNKETKKMYKNTGGEFAEQILADLIAQGYNGEVLLSRFKKAQKEVRPAVEEMLAEAERVAESEAEYETYEDIFGTEED